MNVYVIVRSLNQFSEVWLQRQLNSHSFFKKVFVAGEIKNWNNKPPAVKIPSFNNIYGKMKRRMLVFFKKNIHTQRDEWISKQLKAGDTVVIHFLNFALNFRNLIETGHFKVWVYCHGYDVTWDKYDFESSKPYYKETYVRDVLQLSEHATFICNSTSTLEKLLSIGVAPSNLVINYFGIDLPEGTRPKPDMFTILFLGRLVDFKGPDYVVKAFELACDRGMKAKLVIAGDGYLRPCIELMRRRSVYKDDIQILGAVDAEKAKHLFLTSSVFTAHNCKGELTNQEEAFGVSIIEAMSYGLPVVTGKNGGLVDSVADGETGILFEPFDVEAHANAFLTLYKDEELYAAISANCIKRVEEKFSIKQERENLEKLFAGE